MWKNLSDKTRKRIEAAGLCYEQDFRNLKPGSDHAELFVEYFEDNHDSEEARRKWDCYWWLSTKDLSTLDSSYLTNTESKGGMLEKFESSWGPKGVTPVAWPSEISGWFAERDQLVGEAETRRQAWNTDPYAEDDEDNPAWQWYKDGKDVRDAFLRNNPAPMFDAQLFCWHEVKAWFTAYVDEIARILQTAMPVQDLDTDYIDSLNEVNLKDLTEGQEVKVLGYGTFVLIGEFPPGYQSAVMSYDKAWYGTLTMKEKGGAFSPGKVSVNGCEGKDQEWFKMAFRRVSKKAIKFE
jgi:hypothetical protein